MQSRKWAIAVAVIVTLSGWALAHDRDDDSNVRRHGYQHGYIDGYHHGQEDRGERESYDFHSEDYARADRGYDRGMGAKEDFQDSYRRGYKDGYDDGYANRDPRMAQDADYGGYWRGGDRDSGGNDGDRGYSGDYGRDSSRIPGLSNDPKWTAMDPRSIGYRIGLEYGLSDWINRRPDTPTSSEKYQNADTWYDQATTHRDFKRQFRAGYVEGYQEAYNGDRWHRFGGDGSFGNAFRRGAWLGLADVNRGKPFNPTRLDDYRAHNADPQYQDGFTKGYDWVFRLTQKR